MKTSFRTFLILFVALFSNSTIAQVVSGMVFDEKSKVPLSYASVHIPNTLKGTITNENGFFEIKLEGKQDSIVISYIGYEDAVVVVSQAKQPLKVELKSWEVQLQEVVVRSLSPLEYLKAAIAAYPKTIDQNPFEARGYYQEKTSMVNDNSDAYNLNEAVFKSFIPNFSDTSQVNQNQLVLYRTKNKGKFRSILMDNKKIRKRLEKEKKRDGDSGPITDEEMEEDMDFDLNGMTGGGPQDVLEEAQGILDLPFLDEEYFKKLSYTFGKNSVYKNRELVVIDFESKRRIEKVAYTGSIYLDYDDLAIVAIQYNAKFKIPFLINALIKSIIGISIQDIVQKVSIKNQVKDNFWYPKELIRDVSVTLVQQKEPEVLGIKQLFSIDKISTDQVQSINPELLFDAEKEYETQVHKIPGLTWDQVNVIK